MAKLDHILFEQLKNNDDQKSFEHLFHAYYAPLCAFAYGLLGSHEDAQDIVNDCFMELWSKRESIQIQTSVKSYLFVAVRNLSINHLKKTQKKVLVDSDIKYPFYKQEEVASQIERLQQIEDLEKKLKTSIDALPEQCRYIFYLNRFEHLSYKAIAEKLNLSVGTVKTQIARALKKIRFDFEEVKQKGQIFLLNLVRHF